MYYVIATDLKIGKAGDWKAARMQGSTGFLVWESKDLEQWSQARLCPVNIPESGCIWAPEAVYEEEKEQFLYIFLFGLETNRRKTESIKCMLVTRKILKFLQNHSFIWNGTRM